MITAAHLSFAFVTAGWLTFVAAVMIVAANSKHMESEANG